MRLQERDDKQQQERVHVEQGAVAARRGTPCRRACGAAQREPPSAHHRWCAAALRTRHRLTQHMGHVRSKVWPLGLEIFCLTGYGYMLLSKPAARETHQPAPALVVSELEETGTTHALPAGTPEGRTHQNLHALGE
jgi:hypothetical protein